jgi:Uma2 family endonuclease
MATTALIPLEEFLANPDGKYDGYEYLDGVLIERSMGSRRHGVLQLWFGYLFRRYPQYAAGGEIHSHVRPTEIRIPDVAVQPHEILSQETYGETPYVLTIEILSPDDRLGATFAKCETYHEWGVPYCWVLDPEKRRAWIYNKGDEPRRADEALEAGDIRFALAEVWARLERQA